MGDPGFLDFASKYWVDACREDDNTAELWDHFHTLGLSGRLDLAFRYYDRRFRKTTTCKSDKWIDRLIKAGNRDADVLFLAIYFGIRGFVEKGIEKLEPENDGPRFTERNPSLVKTAASLGHIDSVVLLLKHFSNPEKGFKGAFRAASLRSRYDMILRLLEIGGDGGVALKIAAENDREDVVFILLEHNACTEDRKGRMIDKAFKENWTENVVLLLLRYIDYEDDGPKYLEQSVIRGLFRVVEMLLKTVDINAETPLYRCALCAAAMQGSEPEQLQMVQILLSAGPDIDLHGCNQSPDVVKVLSILTRDHYPRQRSEEGQ